MASPTFAFRLSGGLSDGCPIDQPDQDRTAKPWGLAQTVPATSSAFFNRLKHLLASLVLRTDIDRLCLRMTGLHVGETEVHSHRFVPAMGIGAEGDLAIVADEGVVVEKSNRNFAR